MQSQVLSVVGSEWQGQASGQFNALWDEWQRSAAGLKDALDGISRLLGNAGTQYQQTEQGISHTSPADARQDPDHPRLTPRGDDDHVHRRSGDAPGALRQP